MMNDHWQEVLGRMVAGFHADMASPTGISPAFIADMVAKVEKNVAAGKKGAAKRRARGDYIGRPDRRSKFT